MEISLHKNKSYFTQIVILLGLMIILSQSSELVYGETNLYYANLKFDGNFSKNYTVNNISRIKINSNQRWLGQFYEQNILKVFDLNNQRFSSYFNDSHPIKLQNQILIDFSGNKYEQQKIHFLTSQNYIVIYHIYHMYQMDRIQIQFNVNQQSILKSTLTSFYVFQSQYTQNNTAVIYRDLRKDSIQKFYFNLGAYNRTADQIEAIEDQLQNYTDYSIIQTLIEGKIKAQACKYQTKYDFIAIWNVSSYIQIYKCDFMQCSIQFHVNNFDQINNSTAFQDQSDWITDKISFGPRCQSIIVQYDDKKPIQIYSNDGTLQFTYSSNAPIYSVSTYYYNNNELGIFFKNNSFVICGKEGNQSLYYTQYDNIYNVTQFTVYFQSRRLIITTEDDLLVYWRFQCDQMKYFHSRGFCANCSSTCASCNMHTGRCLTCIPNYKLIGSYCKLLDVPVVIIDKVQNNMTTGAVYYHQSVVADALNDGFGFLLVIMKYIFMFLNALPITWLFMSFINFWSLCSYYYLINADIPQYFQDILGDLYQAVNSPILQIEELSKSILVTQSQSSQFAEKYGLSINFFEMNTQNIILFCGISIMIILYIFFRKYVQLQSLIIRKICSFINPKDVLANQFISFGPSILMPICMLLNGIRFSTFSDLLNWTIYMIFIIFTIAFPLMVTPIQQFKKSLKLSDKKNKEKQRQLFLQKLQWYYNSHSNTLIPILSVIKYSELFYVIGLFFYGFGLWLALNSKNSRINNIILAVYKIIFHLFIIILQLFGKYSVFVRHNLSMICILLLFISAAHQMVTFFYNIIASLFSGSKYAVKAIIQSQKVSDIVENKVQQKKQQQIKQQQEIFIRRPFKKIKVKFVRRMARHNMADHIKLFMQNYQAQNPGQNSQNQSSNSDQISNTVVNQKNIESNNSIKAKNNVKVNEKLQIIQSNQQTFSDISNVQL